MSKNTNLSFLTDYITADITNGRIGINNASPTVAFDVTGIARTSTSTYLATASGNVGIGTISPSDKLNIVVGANGNVARFDGPTSGLIFQTNASTTDIISYGGTTPAYRALNFSTGASTNMTITTAGNVGIGTTTPSDKLTVIMNNNTNGTGIVIRALNDGGTASQPALSFVNGTGNNISQIVADNGTGYLAFNTGTANTERMRITSAGNVGIGTSSPSSILHAAQSNAGNVAISVQNINGSYNSQYRWLNSSSTQVAAITWIQSASSLRFNNNGNDALEITSGGRVLMSTQANGGGSGILEVTNSGGAFADNGPSITCVKSSSTTSSSARFMQFYASNGGQPMGGIVGNGAENVQFATLSDIRDKENIQPIYGSLNKIIALNPVEFNWKKSKEHVKAGFIAQQVEEVFPEYVLDNFANEGDEPRKAITGGLTSGIIVHLVKAIQELSAEITILKNK